MLKKFSVSNYRQFNETLEFDLTASNYAFNQDCVKDDLVKLALIYGENGTGKSTLGWAMFDLVSHLTDYQSSFNQENYLNALSEKNVATFEFNFEFVDKYKKNKLVNYFYTKNEHKNLISEKLEIDGEIIVDYQVGQPFSTTLSGTEHLNKSINPSQNLSAIKYIFSNTNLDKRNPNNALFIKFIEFINHILFFRSVFDGRNFIGYKSGSNNIEQDILSNKNLKNLEEFLKSFGLDFQLVNVKQINKQVIGIKVGKKILPFFDTVSTGTLSLTFFYYWWQSIQKNEVKLLFIDEFDCSYHYALSERIVEKLKELPDTQVILTTHNTNLLSNDLIRPDCGYIINGKEIKSLNHCTEKELRQAHNLERLYQAGAFNV